MRIKEMKKVACAIALGLAAASQAGEIRIERLAPDIVRVREYCFLMK